MRNGKTQIRHQMGVSEWQTLKLELKSIQMRKLNF